MLIDIMNVLVTGGSGLVGKGGNILIVNSIRCCRVLMDYHHLVQYHYDQ